MDEASSFKIPQTFILSFFQQLLSQFLAKRLKINSCYYWKDLKISNLVIYLETGSVLSFVSWIPSWNVFWVHSPPGPLAEEGSSEDTCVQSFFRGAQIRSCEQTRGGKCFVAVPADCWAGGSLGGKLNTLGNSHILLSKMTTMIIVTPWVLLCHHSVVNTQIAKSTVLYSSVNRHIWSALSTFGIFSNHRSSQPLHSSIALIAALTPKLWIQGLFPNQWMTRQWFRPSW